MSSNATSGGRVLGRASRLGGHRVRAWTRTLESPLTTYYGLLAVTGLLVGIGLVMVLSASMIISLKENDSSLTIFLKQLVFAVVGLGVMWFAARRSVSFWRRVALGLLAIGVVLLLLVPFIGFGFQGNKNWIGVGPASIQPSEIAKIGLVLGGALMLERKRPLLGSLSHALIPFVLPVAMGILVLVMLGHDLGTALVIAAIVVGMLFASGLPLRWFALGLGLFAGLGALMASVSSNRMERIAIWLDPARCAPGSDLYYGMCRQSIHGRYALADGGWWGVGLGNSREKWGWLPEPYNDFIFAIIGEELGLLGSFVVLLLFAALGYGLIRIVMRSRDRFVQTTTAAVFMWIVGQALVNIGVVAGVLPVIGVPLPLVSSGGSALLATLIAIGMVLSFARTEDGAREAMRAQSTRVRSSLAVLARRPVRST